MELRGDYLNSFRLNLNSTELNKKIFIWIEKTFDHLSRDESLKDKFELLQNEIQKNIQRLLQIDMA